MELEVVKQTIKDQFAEISTAFFNNSLNIEYVQEVNRVFGEASSMFGANILRYAEVNFDYFFYYLKYLCTHIDIVNLKPIVKEYQKLSITSDLLSIDFIKQADISKALNSTALFFELNFVANLFVFFHECGHLNQTIDIDKDSTDTKHFSEYNSDFYALGNVLKYYYSLRKAKPDNYSKRAAVFGNEHNLIRCIIAITLIVVFIECLANPEAKDSNTHPSIKKRFCNLLYQVQMQLEDNFDFLFTNDKLSTFLADIFKTFYYIEFKMFEKEFILFNDLLLYCVKCFEEIKENMEQSKNFENFNE